MAWLLSKALIDRYANSPSSQVGAGGFSPDVSLAGELYVPSSATNTPQAYSWRDKTTDALSRFRSGMTFALSTEQRGAGVLTSFLAAFPARTFPPQEREPESTASDQVSGPRWRESLAKYDRDSRSWKTRQGLLAGGLAEFSETWPKWGTTRDGVAYLLPTPDAFMCESGCGFWLPTICKNEGKGAGRKRYLGSKDYRGAKMSEALRTCEEDPIYLNPLFAEVVMMFPVGWSDLRSSAMPKFQAWLDSLGEY